MDISDYLKKAVDIDASDIHISTGLPVVMRKHGILSNMDDKILDVMDCAEIIQKIISEQQQETLEQTGELDFVYSLPSVGRFRINAYRQRNSYALAIRIIKAQVPPISQLGLPSIIQKLADKQRGLILVTGPTGSGKSTTLAAMIDYINSNKKCHIVTIEDPIEYLHRHKESIINQREIGSDTQSYNNALRAVLREDPDVILIGEMRDLETISIALTAAETGHLVLSTLHTIGAAKTIDRVIDAFPPHQQLQVKNQLSTVLQGIVSQQLIRRADNHGIVVATEVMILTSAISNMIRESKIHQLGSSIHTGSDYGMHSMDSSLAELYKAGKIDLKSALQHASDENGLRKLLAMN